MLIFFSIRFAELSLGLLRIPVHLKFLGDVGTIYMMYWASQKEELCSVSYSDSGISCCYCALGSDSVFTDYTDYFTLHLILSLAIACTFRKNYIKKDTVQRMRLDEEVFVDFFREYTNVTVSVLTAGRFILFCNYSSFSHIMWQYQYSKSLPATVECMYFSCPIHHLDNINFAFKHFLFLLFSEILSLQRGPESWEQSTDSGWSKGACFSWKSG